MWCLSVQAAPLSTLRCAARGGGWHFCQLPSNWCADIWCWQAHYINNRTMEIFRSMAAPDQASVARQVAAKAPPLDLWRKFLYCESITGPIYGEVDHFKVLKWCTLIAASCA